MFQAWLEANAKYSDIADILTYAEFPQKFVWDGDIHEWRPRKKKNMFFIGRMYFVPPGSGERYYLRILLNVVPGPKSYEDIRNVDGVQFDTFRDACYARGLLEDDKEYIDGIKEASHWGSATSLRNLFTTLLFGDSMSRPEYVWKCTRCYLSEDILYQKRSASGREDLQLTDEEITNLTLWEIEKILRASGKTLHDYKTMPYPRVVDDNIFHNMLIQEELRYDRDVLAEEHKSLMTNLTSEQREIYDTIIAAVEGKTFLWRTLSSALRSKGDIVLAVASSGIAALLIPGGRTAHSRFRIPIDPNEDSTCTIYQGTPLAELVKAAKLIIWDEAPMTRRYCFEALDRTMRDIMSFDNASNNDRPFGGKTIVFGGDFRQILPVIQNATRQDIIHETINSSYVWSHVRVLRLTKNMRLQNVDSNNDSDGLRAFAEWITDIGDGNLGGENHGVATIDIPDDIVIHTTGDTVEAIVENTYPSLSTKLNDSSFLQGRAILTPALHMVELINQYIVSLHTEKEVTYLSHDSMCRSDSNVDLLEDVHTPEFLNAIRCSGVPNHELKLKVGILVMLLRNIDFSQGLCNGTRLVITRLGKHVLEGEIITGNDAGNKVYILRMSLTPSDKRLPFKFQRRQFSVIVSYAMTINKS